MFFTIFQIVYTCTKQLLFCPKRLHTIEIRQLNTRLNARNIASELKKAKYCVDLNFLTNYWQIHGLNASKMNLATL